MRGVWERCGWDAGGLRQGYGRSVGGVWGECGQGPSSERVDLDSYQVPKERKRNFNIILFLGFVHCLLHEKISDNSHTKSSQFI